MIDRKAVLTAFQGDRELLFKLRELTATIRFDLDGEAFDLRIETGQPVAIGDAAGDAAIIVKAPRAFWESALVREPARGFETLSVGGMHGAVTEGPFHELIAPYQGALQRLFIVMRETLAGPQPRRAVDPEPYRATDCTIGRYAYVQCGHQEARVYYEEAGTGSIPLVLQHTAGADGRQYRHLLANPELQRRFRMISWDLPWHGKSLPPIGERWWEEAYRPGKQDLMQWSVAICDALRLDRPIFLGTSVGGQLALDLAAHHADRFRAFVSVNGWYEIRSRGGYNNDIHRHPLTSTDYFASRILAATAPFAPEDSAQEVYWVYRSNFPGVYAGDNEYFMELHDLREDGHLIDATKKPVYVLAGEYDASTLFPQNGGQAVADHVPGVVYRELPGLGHFAPADDPVGFCEAIIPILDEIAAKSR
ncbi:Pimeloyl-ACP methyl ester carboxylesterase [Sphingobium faniae]|nr:Pimeloyl-ACP methyl ester carboxylesterase [Sphingobium faniae]